MKNPTYGWLALALLLAGCATPPGPAAPPGDAPAGPTGAHRTSLEPQAPLQPIARAEVAERGVARLAPPKDLWDRIRRGFAMPDLDTDLVREREQWYSQRPDYLLRMTERSRRYLFHVVDELERRGMPTELALLPFVESAFNPQAVSSAKAAGMWQFMPATGNDYQLKQNVFRDDRRDVLASTRAALDYLQRLYGMFGDWQLALAAYNWGEGSVGRAIARNEKLGLPTGYLDLSMPAETRNYVPKLQAVKNIIAHPESFNSELPAIDNHPYFQSVEIDRDIDVALAARLADIDLKDFRALNPSLHQPVIFASGTPQILLPWDRAAVFRRNLEAYRDGQYASWTAWTAPETMTAATAAQRVGMSEADLRQVNNIPPRMLIKAGSALVVPRTALGKDVTAEVADNGRLSLAPELVTRRIVVNAQRRDTVASLAQRHGVAAAQVAQWNGLRPGGKLRPGQPVALYVTVNVLQPVRPIPEAAATPRLAARGNPAGGRESDDHGKSGDTRHAAGRESRSSMHSQPAGKASPPAARRDHAASVKSAGSKSPSSTSRSTQVAPSPKAAPKSGGRVAASAAPSQPKAKRR